MPRVVLVYRRNVQETDYGVSLVGISFPNPLIESKIPNRFLTLSRKNLYGPE